MTVAFIGSRRGNGALNPARWRSGSQPAPERAQVGSLFDEDPTPPSDIRTPGSPLSVARGTATGRSSQHSAAFDWNHER